MCINIIYKHYNLKIFFYSLH